MKESRKELDAILEKRLIQLQVRGIECGERRLLHTSTQKGQQRRTKGERREEELRAHLTHIMQVENGVWRARSVSRGMRQHRTIHCICECVRSVSIEETVERMKKRNLHSQAGLTPPALASWRALLTSSGGGGYERDVGETA